MAAPITADMEYNHLGECMQSAYRRLHSTETGLLRVPDDILSAIDKNEGVLLVLRDLKATFDTVDHNILLSRLSVQYGIRGMAHQWICLTVTVAQHTTMNMVPRTSKSDRSSCQSCGHFPGYL